MVVTLAQPNLTAISGETADFLAGGEFPVPVPGNLASTTIEYRKYGVSLAYTPTVLSNGRISLRVRPEVSELSTEGAIEMDGFQIPALTIRRAETTVELGSGESFMIAGLMNNRSIGAIDKMKEQAAERVRTDMNYQLTERMVEFRPEHERMLYSLGLSGSAFKKVYFDPQRGRQVAWIRHDLVERPQLGAQLLGEAAYRAPGGGALGARKRRAEQRGDPEGTVEHQKVPLAPR